jgi:glycosyltransferase involved in cell wall biosynthesis
MKNPSFSIIVPTYQRRELVCDTVGALGKAEYQGKFDVIVVVDGSTDGTAAALAALDTPMPVTIIEQENRGLAAARNRGAAEARGEILLFLDDDMIVEPDVLEQHARSYRAGADAVAGGFIEPGFSGVVGATGTELKDGGEAALSPLGLFGGHMSVRRSAFRELGGFDESFTRDGKYGYEDFDLAHRLLQRFSIRRNPKAISHHRKFIAGREYIRRGRGCADAEAYFLDKHPELRHELQKWTGAKRISWRLRLVSRIPVLPRLIAETAAAAAEVGARTPLRSSRAVKYLGSVAYALTYWPRIERKLRSSGL